MKIELGERMERAGERSEQIGFESQESKRRSSAEMRSEFF